jgi:hypothetical protein
VVLFLVFFSFGLFPEFFTHGNENRRLVLEGLKSLVYTG